MAYYDDGYLWPHEHPTYDLVYHQDSVSFSGYETYEVDTYDAYTVSEFFEPKFVDHYHQPNVYDYNYGHNLYSSTSPEINYFAYNYLEPKLIVYEPVACDSGYVSYHTHYSISYPQPMDSGFNEPEFEEYDPTPYGGGYDILSVYGKPLPPSDKTCYPRSNPKPIEPTPGPNPEFEPVSKPIPHPNPKSEPEPEPKREPKPVPIPVPLVEPEPVHVPVPMPEPESTHVTIPVPFPMPEPESEPELLESREVGGMEKEGYSYPDYGYDYPWPEYDHGYGIGVGYHDHGYGKQVVQIPPYEYNPEVVDFCESIFGSWPCLTRIRKQQMCVDNSPQITYPENGQRNPWKDCADYFFRGQVPASYDQ